MLILDSKKLVVLINKLTKQHHVNHAHLGLLSAFAATKTSNGKSSLLMLGLHTLYANHRCKRRRLRNSASMFCSCLQCSIPLNCGAACGNCLVYSKGQLVPTQPMATEMGTISYATRTVQVRLKVFLLHLSNIGIQVHKPQHACAVFHAKTFP